MGLITTLIDRIRGWFGASEADTTAETGPSYQCAICGTAVAAPDATCPLCGSSDIVSEDDESGNQGALSGRPATEQSVSDNVSAAASTLARQDLLSEHEGRWERVDGGYRVSLPDGDRKVGSKDEVRALLHRNDLDAADD